MRLDARIAALSAVALLLLFGGAMLLSTYLDAGQPGPAGQGTRLFMSREILMDVNISSGTLGFNTGTDALHFGRIPAGSGGTKFVELSNTYPFPITVHASAAGEMGKWASFPENDFILNTGAKKNITVSLQAPPDAPLGMHSGKLVVDFYK